MLAEPTRVVCGEKGETLAPARRNRLLADLAAAPPLIEAMQNDGRLNQPEAALLQLELDFLRHKLREMPQISGWEKWSMEQAQRNAGSQPADQPAAASQPAESEPSPDPADYWLKKFLPLLQQEAKANDAHPEAVLLALDQIGMALRWPYPSEEEGDVEVSADGGEVNDEQLIPLLKTVGRPLREFWTTFPWIGNWNTRRSGSGFASVGRTWAGYCGTKVKTTRSRRRVCGRRTPRWLCRPSRSAAWPGKSCSRPTRRRCWTSN